MKKVSLLTLLAAAIGFAQQQGAAPNSKAKKLTREELDWFESNPPEPLSRFKPGLPDLFILPSLTGFCPAAVSGPVRCSLARVGRIWTPVRK